MNIIFCRRLSLLVGFLLVAADPTRAAGSAYDPLALADRGAAKSLDVTVNDEARNREIPLRIYLPAGKAGAPVILFSHGLGGSCKGNAYLGNHWAGRGYVAVFLQHPGSDTSVWQGKPLGDRVAALHRAADAQNFLLRVKDVSAVIDQLEVWNRAAGHALHGRLELEHLGMSGHSFGAITTQAVSGQSFRGSQLLTDRRIKAAVAMSPSSPQLGGDPAEVFGKVKIPWLLMTGTKDLARIGNIDMKSRLGVFPALPSGGKYELVLEGAEHSAFGDRALPGDTEKRNPNHHRAILALSTAFWDAYLRGDRGALAWLDGAGPRSVLEKNDRWQTR